MPRLPAPQTRPALRPHKPVPGAGPPFAGANIAHYLHPHHKGPEGEALYLEGVLAGRRLELPSRALFFLAESLPSVAGGPADPEVWDRYFGAATAEGDAERLARQRKGEALPGPLADLYGEVRALRRRGRAPQERLRSIQEALRAYPEDWLLKQEVEELLTTSVSPRTKGLAPHAAERT